jgi:hypothetical protein
LNTIFIASKGKISDIQLKFNGATTELIDNKIRMSVRFGEMDETLPASWTEEKQVKRHCYWIQKNQEQCLWF